MKKELLLGLLQLPKVGSKTAYKILEKSSGQETSIEDLYNLVQDSLKVITRLPKFSLEEITAAVNKAESISAECKKLNINILTIKDSKYPKNLKDLNNAPLLIYVKGNIEILNSTASVAVIGTREPTDFGKKAGYKLTKYFVDNNFTVVSGLAIGCDTVGHRSCLDHGGKTIAVLASGLDKIYPKQNSKLALEILEKGGALISEYPPGTSPRNNYFVERDRLQSGLSQAICIIETDRIGGTMHTFKFATAQNREIGALSHPPQFQTVKSNGNRYIIEERGGYSLGTSEEINHFINILKNITDSNIEAMPKEQYENNSQLRLFN